MRCEDRRLTLPGQYKESLKEMFFRTYQHLEVKENRSDVNNNGGIPK